MERLRDRLSDVGFTVERVQALLGPAAHDALLRNETTPAERATRDGSALSTLVRLFSLQRREPASAVEAALPGQVEALEGAGILARDGDAVRALVDVRPYGDEAHDWWVVCDLTPGLDTRPVEVGPEHVLGISEASSSLAQLTVPRAGTGATGAVRALDLGTGCGVQALHLAQGHGSVVATDVNPRALWAARLTADLNGLDVDVRDGSFWDPVAGERFDTIATNPPFVVSPPTGERLVYREGSLETDGVVRTVVDGAADHLRPGGWCQVLGSWVHTDEPWEERLRGWIEPTGLDAWVVQREVVDLPAYVEMWLADAGARHRPDYAQRYDAWLDWFDAQGVRAMAFGWISLRAAGREAPALRLEEWRHEVVPPVGAAVLAWGDRVDALGAADDVLDVRWRQAPSLTQETFGRAGEEDPEAIVLRLGEGLRRAAQVDTVEAGLVGALDGDLTAGQVLDALARLLDRDAAALREQYRPVVHELVADGLLVP
jgi:methylase of polypeptide subunit release factors